MIYLEERLLLDWSKPSQVLPWLHQLTSAACREQSSFSQDAVWPPPWWPSPLMHSWEIIGWLANVFWESWYWKNLASITKMFWYKPRCFNTNYIAYIQVLNLMDRIRENQTCKWYQMMVSWVWIMDIKSWIQKMGSPSSWGIAVSVTPPNPHDLDKTYTGYPWVPSGQPHSPSQGAYFEACHPRWWLWQSGRWSLSEPAGDMGRAWGTNWPFKDGVPCNTPSSSSSSSSSST